MKKKLAEEEHAQKNADVALESAQRQAENQRKLTREANDQLATSKEQLATLRKQLVKPKGSKIRPRKQKLRQRS